MIQSLRSLNQLIQHSWLLGLLGTVLCPLILALFLKLEWIPSQHLSFHGLVQELGYTLTGLVMLTVVLLKHRSDRFLKGSPKDDEATFVRKVTRHILGSLPMCWVGMGAGLAYWTLAGSGGARYVAGFFLMTPIMYFGLVHRPAIWRRTADSHWRKA